MESQRSGTVWKWEALLLSIVWPLVRPPTILWIPRFWREGKSRQGSCRQLTLTPIWNVAVGQNSVCLPDLILMCFDFQGLDSFSGGLTGSRLAVKTTQNASRGKLSYRATEKIRPPGQRKCWESDQKCHVWRDSHMEQVWWKVRHKEKKLLWITWKFLCDQRP